MSVITNFSNSIMITITIAGDSIAAIISNLAKSLKPVIKSIKANIVLAPDIMSNVFLVFVVNLSAGINLEALEPICTPKIKPSNSSTVRGNNIFSVEAHKQIPKNEVPSNAKEHVVTAVDNGSAKK